MNCDQGKPCSSRYALFSSINVPKYSIEWEEYENGVHVGSTQRAGLQGLEVCLDSVADLRRRNGEKSYRILSQENGSNDLVALFEWDSLDNARKYAASPELKEAMQRAGVVGKPEILFLEEAARG